MTKSQETLDQSKEQELVLALDSLLKRVEEVEDRCTKLETTLKETLHLSNF